MQNSIELKKNLIQQVKKLIFRVFFFNTATKIKNGEKLKLHT